MGLNDRFQASGGLSIQRIGDSSAPGIIAAAIYSGHKVARELGINDGEGGEVPRDTIFVNFNPESKI